MSIKKGMRSFVGEDMDKEQFLRNIQEEDKHRCTRGTNEIK